MNFARMLFEPVKLFPPKERTPPPMELEVARFYEDFDQASVKYAVSEDMNVEVDEIFGQETGITETDKVKIIHTVRTFDKIF